MLHAVECIKIKKRLCSRINFGLLFTISNCLLVVVIFLSVRTINTKNKALRLHGYLYRMPNNTNLFYSGTSGIQLPVAKSEFPAEFRQQSRLAYYASFYNSIEINSIFYKLPRASTITNWSETVPDNFRFSFKVSKAITHAKNLEFDNQDVEDFVQTVEHVGPKKGCLLAQFPPSLQFEKIDRVQNFLEVFTEAICNKNWRLAVEFRHPSWYERETYELLEEYDASLVLHDIATSATPFDVSKGNLIYLRFHGPEARYRGNYSEDVLKHYADHINRWILDGKTVFAYFNNTVGAAMENLNTLKSMIVSQS